MIIGSIWGLGVLAAATGALAGWDWLTPGDRNPARFAAVTALAAPMVGVGVDAARL